MALCSIEVLGDKGGSTKEPVSQKPLQLSYTDKLAAMVADIRLGQRVDGIIVSPWSSMITARALWDAESNKTPIADALVSSARVFLDHFAGIAFLGSDPVDPAADVTGGLPSGAIHGFITCGLAEMGADMSRRLRLSEGNFLINVLSVTQWLAWQDLRADGRFDGRGVDGPIRIVDDVTVDIELTQPTLERRLVLSSPRRATRAVSRSPI